MIQNTRLAYGEGPLPLDHGSAMDGLARCPVVVSGDRARHPPASVQDSAARVASRRCGSLWRPIAWPALLVVLFGASLLSGDALAVETLDFGTATGGGNLLATPMNTNVGGITVNTSASQSGGPWDATPTVSTSTGGLNGVNGVIFMTMDAALGSSLPWTQVTFSFSRPVTNLQFSLNDIDGGPLHSWNDRVVINATPTLTPSVLSQGAQVSWTAATRTAQATANANSTSAASALRLGFAQPVTQVTVRYIAGPSTDGSGNGPNSQTITIDDLTWDSGTVAVQKLTSVGVGGPFTFTQTNLLTTPSGITTTAVGVATPASAVAHEISAPGTNVSLTESSLSGWALTSATCSDANSAVTGNVGTFGTLSGNTITLNSGSLVLSGANITCRFTNTVVQPSFGTCDGRMFLGTSDGAASDTQLNTINIAANPISYSTLGPPGSPAYDAIGYNPLDNYIYGIEYTGFSGNQVYRIGADGSVVVLGTLSLSTGGTFPDINVAGGAFSPSGEYYISSRSTDTLYRVNLATLVATPVVTHALLDSIIDFAFVGSDLYAPVGTGRVVRITTSGVVSTIGGGVIGSGSPSVWGSPNGGLYSLVGGNMYQWDLTWGQRVLIGTGPSTSDADGTNCPSGNLVFPTELSITKTNTPAQGPSDLIGDLYVPGEVRTYRIVVSADVGSLGVLDATVTDAVPAGIDPATVSWTCSSSSGGWCGFAGSGTGALNDTGVDVPAGGSVIYMVTMTVPTGFSGDLINTATVTAPPTRTETNTGNNTATDTDPRTPLLTIRKTSLGGVGSFGFTGTNGTATQTLTTITAGTPQPGARQALTAASTATTITESTSPSTYRVTDITCTGLGAGGTATPDLANRSVALDTAATAAGSDIVCTFTNTLQQADLQVVKTASPNPVVSGDVVTYTLVVTNNGPNAVTNAVLSDVASSGQTCTVAATCTPTGGATCPSPTVPAATLLGGGMTIPNLPIGGQVTVALSCTVTASGTP